MYKHTSDVTTRQTEKTAKSFLEAIVRKGAQRMLQLAAEAWRKGYTYARPHNSLGYLMPAEFAAQAEEEKSRRRFVPEVPVSLRLPFASSTKGT